MYREPMVRESRNEIKQGLRALINKERRNENALAMTAFPGALLHVINLQDASDAAL